VLDQARPLAPALDAGRVAIAQPAGALYRHAVHLVPKQLPRASSPAQRRRNPLHDGLIRVCGASA